MGTGPDRGRPAQAERSCRLVGIGPGRRDRQGHGEEIRELLGPGPRIDERWRFGVDRGEQDGELVPDPFVDVVRGRGEIRLTWRRSILVGARSRSLATDRLVRTVSFIASEPVSTPELWVRLCRTCQRVARVAARFS